MKNSNSKPSKQQKIDAIVAERGQIYGDKKQSHRNIGLAWTGLLQQHYGVTLNHPLPLARPA